jgi:hypothetical protein
MACTRALVIVLLSVLSFCDASPHLHGNKKHKGAHKKGGHGHKQLKLHNTTAQPIVSPPPQQLCSVNLPRHAVQEVSQDDALGWLDKVFGKEEENSYNIPDQDKKAILASAVRFSKEAAIECSEDSYGEILQTSASKLFAHPLVQLKPGETFADLGSGLGQLVMDAVLVGEAKRSVGVELSAQRSKEACTALQEVEKALPVTQLSGWRAARHESQTQIFSGDLFGLPDSLVNELNVVYVANLCFRPAMLKALALKLDKALPEGARVASLRKFDSLPEKSRLTMTGVVDLPMSWSMPGYSQAVYIYKAGKV